MSNPIQTRNQLQEAGNSMVNSTSAKPGKGENLGKDDFIKLMMTQMTNQNPLDPMDSKGMMEQFAQMGTMEQLQNLNKQVEEMNRNQLDLVRAQGFQYLNKDVTVRGGMINVNGGIAQPLSFKLPEAAQVSAFITDNSGNTIRSMDLGSKPAGSHLIPWDHKDSKGNQVNDGQYRVSVIAKGMDEKKIEIDLFMTSRVSGVRYDNGKAMLKIQGGEVDSREVMAVSNESERNLNTREPKPIIRELAPKPPLEKERGMH
ncbi:MAG: hypothetical protein OEV94_06480 [Deltaproteobacteria bacterium]|nr:hypothetical protein [Deltaproteobacteria bacterium]